MLHILILGSTRLFTILLILALIGGVIYFSQKNERLQSILGVMALICFVFALIYVLGSIT